MSLNTNAQGPNPAPKPSWSDLPKAQRIALIVILAVLVLCCGVLLLPDAEDADSPGEVATEAETTESPTELEPTTARAVPTEAATTPSPEPPEATEAVEATEAEEVYYENCDAVRAAGAAPIHEGEPGYRAGLDRDGDGEGCEDSSSGSGSDSGGGGGGSGDGNDDDDDDGGGSVYYENCDAVRAAGAAPIHAGEPGYGSHLDRDGDGTGCEG